MEAKYEFLPVHDVDDVLTDAMRMRLVRAYAERLDGSTGPMSIEAWYLSVNDSTNRALERRGLTEFKTFKGEVTEFEEDWRLLSDWGVRVAAHVVEKYEITWGPKS
jgi:chromosome condensin MukBEF complex kleisin-like MukF subunit